MNKTVNSWLNKFSNFFTSFWTKKNSPHDPVSTQNDWITGLGKLGRWLKKQVMKPWSTEQLIKKISEESLLYSKDLYIEFFKSKYYPDSGQLFLSCSQFDRLFGGEAETNLDSIEPNDLRDKYEKRIKLDRKLSEYFKNHQAIIGNDYIKQQLMKNLVPLEVRTDDHSKPAYQLALESWFEKGDGQAQVDDHLNQAYQLALESWLDSGEIDIYKIDVEQLAHIKKNRLPVLKSTKLTPADRQWMKQILFPDPITDGKTAEQSPANKSLVGILNPTQQSLLGALKSSQSASIVDQRASADTIHELMLESLLPHIEKRVDIKSYSSKVNGKEVNDSELQKLIVGALLRQLNTGDVEYDTLVERINQGFKNLNLKDLIEVPIKNGLDFYVKSEAIPSNDSTRSPLQTHLLSHGHVKMMDGISKITGQISQGSTATDQSSSEERDLDTSSDSDDRNAQDRNDNSLNR